MLINNINISTFGATLIERYMDNHEIVTINDWIDGSPSPVYFREYARYKNIELAFLIEGESEQVVRGNIETLVKTIKRSTLKFDDLNFYFDVHLEGTVTSDKLTNGFYKVTVPLLAYKTYTPLVTTTANAVATKVVSNLGSMNTEAEITIVPASNVATYTITGLSDEPIVLKNLVAGATYKLDGMNYTYTKNGANEMANFSGFEFPILKPGNNTVGFSPSTANVTIKHYPKYY